MVSGEVLHSQGRVAHHKQDMFSMYVTVYKTYIFFVHRPARVSWSVTLYIHLPRSAGVWTLGLTTPKSVHRPAKVSWSLCHIRKVSIDQPGSAGQ